MQSHVQVLDQESRNPGSYFGRHGTRDTTAMIRGYLAKVTVSFCVTDGVIYRLLRHLDGAHTIEGDNKSVPITAPEYQQIELLSVEPSVFLSRLPVNQGITVNYAYTQRKSYNKNWFTVLIDYNGIRYGCESTISLSEVWKCNKQMHPGQRCYVVNDTTIDFPPGCLAIRFDAAGRMLRLETDGRII